MYQIRASSPTASGSRDFLLGFSRLPRGNDIYRGSNPPNPRNASVFAGSNLPNARYASAFGGSNLRDAKAISAAASDSTHRPAWMAL